MPIDVSDIEAYDIYRMMENIYFDGLENTNSQLIWLIMFWGIPLPVVNQDWYVFPTVYPYVDFENQKYVWDETSQYFVPNWNKKWQAEVWHWLIDYWTDIDAYLAFFDKIKAYVDDPDEFIGDSMWYEDFIAQKEALMDEDFQYYRNKIMFWEDIWYQRYSTFMKKLFWWESSENSSEIISELGTEMWIDLMWMDWVEDVLAQYSDSSNTMHTTKLNQQEIETSYLADYNEIFSKKILSTIRENIFAWWRRIKLYRDEKWKASQVVDVDNSASMIQLKDTMYLWNDDLQWIIENLNMLMEEMVDKKIAENKYDMDIVVPVSYIKTTWKRISFRCYKLVSRFDNYYFWNNARYIDKSQDLSAFRWTYRNLLDLDWVTYDSLKEWNNPIISEYDPVDIKLKSIWASYGIFSDQVLWNRWFMMNAVDRDLDIYDEEKVTEEAQFNGFRALFEKVVRLTWPKDCSDDDEDELCEDLFAFSHRWWWWASPINLDEESVEKWRYRIKWYIATDAWRPIFDMWWFQSLLSWDDEWIDGRWWVDWEWKWPQWAATSFKAYIKYSSPTQREWWKKSWGRYWIYENKDPNVHMNFSDMDYWQLSSSIIDGWNFSKESKSIFNVTKKNSLLSCPVLWESTMAEQYTYKVISSIVEHKSPTEDEINWIDKDRYWESWTLWQYYRDLSLSYQNVKDDTVEILDGLGDLTSEIEEVKNLIENILEKDLKDNVEDLFEASKELKRLEWVLSWYELNLTEKQQLLATKKQQKESGSQNSEIDELSWWISDIEDISEKIENLLKELDDVGSWNSLSNSSKNKILAKISSLQKDTESLMSDLMSDDDEELEREELDDDDDLKFSDILENAIANLKAFDWWFSSKADKLKWDIDSINASSAGLEQEIKNLESEIKNLEENLIPDTKKAISVEKDKVKPLEDKLIDLLLEIKKKITQENLDLSDIYKLIMSIFVENIITVMEYISYMEWWNPEDFYAWIPNKAKVWFLSEWISNIEGIEKGIKSDWEEIITVYEEVYSLLEKQQDDWKKFVEEMKESEEFQWIDESFADKLDEITELLDAIFKVSDKNSANNDENGDDSDQDSEGQTEITLVKSSAKDAIKGEFWLFDRFDSDKWVNDMFSRLIEVDTVWPAIEQAAKSDVDFRRWLLKNSVDFSNFSQSDWINQYAKWTKWPWYDSEWAKKNHDLLIWVSEHMSWMNILTPDRPIDSPRYVSMQSVAWRDMKFIYPDLFKVEVYVKIWEDGGYDIHELLLPSSIKNNLIKYLKWKVKEYNKILDEECSAALWMNNYYDRLTSLWYIEATPDTWVHHCGEKFTYDEFVEALWWEKMLDVISDILYYQSITHPVKAWHEELQKEIKKLKKGFGVNEKRRLTLLDYLTEWMEEIKNPLYVIPMYEIYWYEVAYVNSNWRDFLFTDDDSKITDNVVGWLSYSTKGSKARSTGVVQPSKQENDYSDACNIPPSWRLPLFKLSWTSVSSPWYEWFKCWLKKTLEEPIKIRLSFDNSLWDVVISEWFGKFMESLWKSMFSETSDTFVQYGDAWTKYLDAWDEIIDPKTEFDADKRITQAWVEAEKRNKEALQWWGGASSLANNVKLQNSNALLSDSNPASELRIESTVDIWDITVEFVWIWDESCLDVAWNVVCDGGSFSKTFNPKTNPFTWSVSSSNHIAWKIWLDIKISGWWWYLEKVMKYTVSPSFLERAEITVGDEKTVAWMISPVNVVWYDKYGNSVSRWTEKYDFTVSQWRFLKDWSYQDSFTTNDFRDLRFYYHAPLDAPDGSEAVIQISNSRNSDNYLATYHQTVVQAAPEIKLNWSIVLQWRDNLVTNQSYKLKSDESIYEWKNLALSKLQRIDIEMKDPNWGIVDVDSQIMVTSLNWLVVIGQVQQDDDGNDMFFDTSMNYMSSGYATIYYYPSTIAWDDVISIDIPWLDTRIINLKVYPAETATVQVNINEWYVEAGETTPFEIFVSDIRWNPVDDTVLVTYDPWKVRFPELTPVSHDWDLWIDKADIKDWYLKTPIYWKGGWLTEVIVEASSASTTVQFKVDDDLFPADKLNILYLNYFWNDRWNQWWYFSDNNKYIEQLMTNSNKIITTTTQLVSEDKIKKMVWKIQPKFKIWNYDNINTIMSMNWSKLDVVVWWLSAMHISMPSLTWMSVSKDEMNTILSNEASASKNYWLFVPSDEKYFVDKKWVLYSDWVRIWSILNWEITLRLDDYSIDNWDNVWKVVDRWINYWDFILHYPSFMPSAWDFDIPAEWYVVNHTFYNWTTDKLYSVWVFDFGTDFELETSYKSIQNSDEVDERIGFLGDFKNITLFAEWEIVWEATKKFGSEFVINLWDPVLTKKDLNEPVYGTNFDWWIWNEIYVDSENDIFWNYQIDFNNDWLEDLLVAYVDWTIRLAKNYWGTPDLRNMQELMHVAVSLKDIYVWDADGNWYDDILVITKNNQLRVYLNDWWIFDVDWSIACLNQNVFWWEVSSAPSNLEWIFQMFIEDMDQDGIVDVVTYDNKWYIKVFYWWSTNWWPNYLSKEKYACDSWWYNRQANNTTLVTAMWVQISGADVFDNSMLRWDTMERPPVEIEEDDLSHYWIHFDPNSLVDLISEREHDKEWDISAVVYEIMDTDPGSDVDPKKVKYKSDISEMSQRYVDEWAKYVDITLYENELMRWWNWDNYVFAPSSYLDPGAWIYGDDGSVRKNYYVKSWSAILQDGDIVTVRVTVKANDYKPFRWTYWDIIQWPWNLYFDEHEMFKWIRFISNQRWAFQLKRDGNFAYIIDNITLSAWEKMIFEYDLEYHNMPLKKIGLTYETYYSSDALPDIKVQSVDWCEKNFGVFINWWRSFAYDEINLVDKINEEYLGEDEKTEDYAADVISVWSDVNQLPWIVWDSINRISLLNWKNAIPVSNDEGGKKSLKNTILQMLDEWFNFDSNAGISLDIDLSIFEGQTDEIENVIDDITKWMCNGFSFGWENNCKWLPVPFNQAFLAPGKYHLFGCWELPLWPLEWWIPVFFFPWTFWTTFWPIPIPRWLKSSSDWFLWPWTWVYPSFIRIYAAPTLTAQLWIAICLSPDAVWRNVPSPISDIMWNCVVFAVKPQCDSDSWDGWTDSGDLDNPNEVYTEYIEDVRDSWVCLQTQKWFMVTLVGERSTPFDLCSFSANKKHLSNVNVDGWRHNDVEYSASFMWILELETASYVWSDSLFTDNTQNSITIGDVDILWWQYNVNKIKWWLQQWIRKLLIDKWLDPQIRYILNQLTKMHIDIKFPDISNLIDNEVQTISDISNNIGSIWENDEENEEDEIAENSTSNKKSVVSYRSGITYDSLKEFNKSIANPFEALASLMNESNIINISMENVDVKIPMIFKEDIDSYYLYLQQWLDRNEKIINEWESKLETLAKNCSKESTQEAQQDCRDKRDKEISSFIEFRNIEWQRMQTQIYANLVILQKYREFPFEIYEWIHVIDTYMSEIASLINNTIWYLSYWTSTNSQRFVWYVDAIVLIINIIKTYQLLIDFSIDWWQNCGNCARDTYDQYSCKLSFLCDMIQLPIIQIPNFKLPNITIDLTNIDLWLDIVLPEFNFQPVRINLPQLPDLPEPPTISIDIKLLDLPNIPLLPEPPELPELPSFIPEIELELPMLPPAPEVPRLPNEIEVIINVAKIIWKIYCIVKWQFWLVGESSVKAKIEQITQRTYDVDWIDTIMDFTNWSFAPIHNYWVDYEIDSYVDLQFNFTDFYDYLDTLTKSINTLTTSTVNWSNTQLNKLVDENPLTEFRDEVDGKSIDVDVQVFGNWWLISKSDFNVDADWIVSDDVEYVDYESWRNRLRDVLAYFRQEVTNTSLEDSVNSSITKIEHQINRHNNIVSNEKWIEKLKGTVLDYIDSQKESYDNLANMINSDYDSFLAMVDSNSKWMNVKSNGDNKLLTFNVQLFNLDSATRDSIDTISKSNPYKALVDNKQNIINWYMNAISTNSAEDLWLSTSQYLVLRNNISSMKNRVNTLYRLMEPVSSTKLIAKDWWESSHKSLLAAAQVWGSKELWKRIWSQMDAGSVIDPSLLSKGIYEKNAEWKFTKVIYSDTFSEDMKDTYYHTTHTSNHDIVLWDRKSVYKKCQWQNCINYWWNDGRYYHSKVIEEIPYEETRLEFNGGLKLKIADYKEEIKNRELSNQNYDILSFSWKLDDADGYLIKLVERIDYSYEKVDYNPGADKRKKPHYVLALPDTVEMTDVLNNNLKLELLNNKTDKIESLSWNELLQIVYYNPSKPKANVGISNIDRKRYYARIVSLDLVGDTYSIMSPWSNQVTAWRQIVWDDQTPNWNPVLIRKATWEITSEWDDLEWYVWTRYKLKIDWKDNVALYYINISKDGKILDEKYTKAVSDSVSTDIDIHTKTEKETYTIKWIDQFGNNVEKNITVAFNIPEIAITDVSSNPDWGSVAITAELSQDIDQWNVSFQRRRWTSRKSMWDLSIWVWDRIVVWSPFSVGNDIAMYGKNWEPMALMNPGTAEIKLQTWYEDSFEIRVLVENNSVLQVVDKTTQKPTFSIIIPSLECVKFEADGYTIADLPEKWKMGEFNWWKVVYKDWENVLFVSKTCSLRSDYWLEWTYDYDRELDAVKLTLYQKNDISKKYPIKVRLKVEPFMAN